MNEPKQSQEPTMEEILASIRRIISEDDAGGAQKPNDASDSSPVTVQPITTSSEPAADRGDDVVPDDGMSDEAVPDGDPFAVGDPLDQLQERTASDGVDATHTSGTPLIPEDDDILELTERLDEPPLPVESDDWPAPGSPTEPFDRDGSKTQDDSMPKRDQFDDLDFESAFDEATADTPADGPETSGNEFEADDSLVSGATAAATAAAFSKLKNEREIPSSGGDALPIGDGTKTVEGMVRELLRPMLREWLDQNLHGIVEEAVRREIERVGKGAGRR